MTDRIPAASDASAERRWRAWQARGVETDRRTAARMGTLTVLVAAGLIAWLLSRFV